MLTTQLIPSVEKRISSWIDVVQKQKTLESELSKPEHATITISREFGCEAYPIAEILQKKLSGISGKEWITFDRAMMDKVLEDNDLTRRAISSIGERPRFLDNLFSAMSSHWKNEEKVYQLLSETLVALAKERHAILIGMGSCVITQKIENTFHFRLVAPMEFKIQSISKRLNLDPKEAESMIEKEQAKRDQFIHRYLDKNVHDMTYYDAVFNNGKASNEKIADMILKYIGL